MTLEQYRRGLIRPLTETTAEDLRAGELPDHTDIEYFKISDALYEKYFQVFNDLDRICGVAGDDFTVEEVEPERLECVCRTLKTYPRKNDRALDEFVDYLWGVCIRAQEAGQPVFFVL